jgi:hypothetical protein
VLPHRRHWNAYEVGVFVQAPVVAVKVRRSTGGPEMIAGDVLTGGCGTTTRVAELVADVVPVAFRASTANRMLAPTSRAISL